MNKKYWTVTVEQVENSQTAHDLSGYGQKLFTTSCTYEVFIRIIISIKVGWFYIAYTNYKADYLGTQHWLLSL